MNDATLSATGVIGGQAFYDSNNDGIRDTDTPSNINGVGNINVWLFTCNDDTTTPQSLAHSITASNGIYRFTDLNSGMYYIIAQPPIGYQFSNIDKSAGSISNMFVEISTINPETGRTVCFELEEGEKTMDWSFGLYEMSDEPSLQPSMTNAPTVPPTPLPSRGSTHTPSKPPSKKPTVTPSKLLLSAQPSVTSSSRPSKSISDQPSTDLGSDLIHSPSSSPESTTTTSSPSEAPSIPIVPTDSTYANNMNEGSSAPSIQKKSSAPTHSIYGPDSIYANDMNEGSNDSSSSGANIGMVIGISVGVLTFFVIIMTIAFVRIDQKRRRDRYDVAEVYGAAAAAQAPTSLCAEVYGVAAAAQAPTSIGESITAGDDWDDGSTPATKSITERPELLPAVHAALKAAKDTIETSGSIDEDVPLVHVEAYRRQSDVSGISNDENNTPHPPHRLEPLRIASGAEMKHVHSLEQEVGALSMALNSHPKYSKAWLMLHSYVERAREELEAVREDLSYHPNNSHTSHDEEMPLDNDDLLLQSHLDRAKETIRQDMETATIHMDITAPSGNLGLVVDKRSCGGVIIRDLHPLSPLRDQIQPNDEIIAIGDQDVQQLSLMEFGKLICQYRPNSQRKITIARKMLPETTASAPSIGSGESRDISLENSLVSSLTGVDGTAKAAAAPKAKMFTRNDPQLEVSMWMAKLIKAEEEHSHNVVGSKSDEIQEQISIRKEIRDALKDRPPQLHETSSGKSPTEEGAREKSEGDMKVGALVKKFEVASQRATGKVSTRRKTIEVASLPSADELAKQSTGKEHKRSKSIEVAPLPFMSELIQRQRSISPGKRIDVASLNSATEGSKTPSWFSPL